MPGKSKQQQATAVRFAVGSRVRVKAGTTDPDFPGIPLGGWTGKVREIRQEPPATDYLVGWDRYTLNSVHPVYRSRCERKDLDPESMWLVEDELEPDGGEPARIEQPTAIVPLPLSPDDERDRIRAALGLKSGDDPIPPVDLESLRRYHHFLVAHLSFPVRGKLGSAIGPHRDTVSPISVIGLIDAGDYCPDEASGLICQAVQKGRRIEYPLANVLVDADDPNRQIVDDYLLWFSNGA
jgi:hypothetical protein